MDAARIEPHRITRPTQLTAVWLAAAVLVDGSLVGGAVAITDPAWVSPMLAVGAIVIPLVVVVLVFLMQTKFRPQLQEDSYYSEYVKWERREFRDFQPENIDSNDGERSPVKVEHESWEERERRRIEIYERSQGVFLVHSWRPSRVPGQVADITISLYQHEHGPLTDGRVESVEYHLGQKFFDHPVVKTNVGEGFRLDVSAYGPMLCLAKVHFSDGTPPLDLERYIDF